MQELWSGIRSIINVGKCKNSYITSILNNSKSLDNPTDIANIFNTSLLILVRVQRRESLREVIAPYSTLGVLVFV